MKLEDNKIRLYKIKTVALYALFGGLWILFSDQALSILVSDQKMFTEISILKGWLFILFTTVLLYALISKDMEAVNRLNHKFKGYFKQALMGMVALDQFGKVVEMNATASQILKIKDQNMTGKDFFECLNLRYHADDTVVTKKDRLSERDQGVVVYFTMDQEGPFYVLMTDSQLSDDQGAGSVLMFIDVTEKVMMEDALMEMNMALEDKVQVRTAELKKTVEDLEGANKRILVTERMTALGELASGISMEISTPVGIAITAVSYMGVEVEKLQAAVNAGGLKKSYMESTISAMEEAYDLAQRNLEKASEVISSFKQMSTDIHSNQKRYFKVSEIIGDTIISLRPFIKKGDYRFAIRTGDDEPIFGYPGAISQILSNLILNAIQHGFADRQDGLMTIETEIKELNLIINFKDDGVGIPGELRHEVFKPYFTIDGNSDGAGLGLSILYKLVTSDLGGSIECYEADFGGAGFVISMPVSDITEKSMNGVLHRL